MSHRQNTSIGVDNPWYPEGGPGRHLKARLKRGEVLIGPLLEEYARPSLIKLFRHAGFDFVYIEYEHTFFGLPDLADTILSARDNGLPVIAKTPQLERQEVSKLLEAGVVGIQLPRTETREQVETLLSYLKFPPKGTERWHRAGATATTEVSPIGRAGWMSRTRRPQSSSTSRQLWLTKMLEIS